MDSFHRECLFMPINDLKATTAKLMRGALKHAGQAALAAALVPLGAVTAQGALIDSSAAPNGGGGFTYSFTLSPTISISSGFAAKMLLPLFDAGDVSNIVDAPGWTHVLETPLAAGWTYTTAADASLAGSPFKYGNNPQVFNDPPLVLAWTNSNYFGSGESGFSFDSAFGPLNAPFMYSDALFGTAIVDPLTPDSPARIAGQTPEPSTWVLLVTAGTALGAGRLWRRRGRADA
jgi:hypothetical protein